MSYYYNSVTGSIFQQVGAAKWATDREIWVLNHDPIPGTDLYGPFGTQAEAEAAKKAHPPLDLNPLDNIGQGFASVGEWVLRGAEIVIGIVILAIALNVILKETTGVNVAGKAASGTAKAATLAAV